jgi:DNA-binding transcriptional LysR family regulator
MQDLNDLYHFAAVVDHGGFAPAGRALGLPKSKLSRRIAELEARLGVRLIQRSTRRFVVTELGQAYYRHCAAMRVEAESAQELIERTRAEPRGIVRLSCPVALLNHQVGDMLARYMTQCPQVQIQLESTNRRVDVIAEGFDLALRVRFPPLEDSDLVLRVLGESRQRLVAHPQLLKQLPALPGPADLGRLPSLDWSRPEGVYEWCLDGPDGASAKIRHAPRYVTDDMIALRSAARQGVGVVQLPVMLVREELDRGDLVDVLPQWAPRSGIVHAVFPSRRGLLPAVRSLIDFLAEAFAELARANEAPARSA